MESEEGDGLHCIVTVTSGEERKDDDELELELKELELEEPILEELELELKEYEKVSSSASEEKSNSGSSYRSLWTRGRGLK